MDVSPSELSAPMRYKLLTGLIVPRPIAWVSSLSANGVPNLAPFSYFSIVGHAPMAVSISVTGRKPDGSPKDTGSNVMPVDQGGRGEFIVNLVSEHQAEAMAKTARPLATTCSEFELAGLTPLPGRQVRAPRVAGALAALECRTRSVVPIGSSRLVVAEVVHLTIDDDVVDSTHRIDFNELAAIGRMAGSQYSRTTDRFTLVDEGYFPVGDTSR
jgi:flavin reductase (DIM6/NTAB) family NADH-FMN oxidoreductase RutF